MYTELSTEMVMVLIGTSDSIEQEHTQLMFSYKIENRTVSVSAGNKTTVYRAPCQLLPILKLMITLIGSMVL